jgi:hypothetical protein
VASSHQNASFAQFSVPTLFVLNCDETFGRTKDDTLVVIIFEFQSFVSDKPGSSSEILTKFLTELLAQQWATLKKYISGFSIIF